MLFEPFILYRHLTFFAFTFFFMNVEKILYLIENILIPLSYSHRYKLCRYVNIYFQDNNNNINVIKYNNIIIIVIM